MSESSGREERIFAEALVLPEGERQRFIVEACQGDGDLRKRVEALVRAHESAEGFMDAPPATETEDIIGDSPLPPVMTEAAGSRIGRYKLLQRLGEGGCGVVWMAEQEEPVRRAVAPRLPKLGTHYPPRRPGDFWSLSGRHGARGADACGEPDTHVRRQHDCAHRLRRHGAARQFQIGRASCRERV